MFFCPFLSELCGLGQGCLFHGVLFVAPANGPGPLPQAPGPLRPGPLAHRTLGTMGGRRLIGIHVLPSLPLSYILTLPSAWAMAVSKERYACPLGHGQYSSPSPHFSWNDGSPRIAFRAAFAAVSRFVWLRSIALKSARACLSASPVFGLSRSMA